MRHAIAPIEGRCARAAVENRILYPRSDHRAMSRSAADRLQRFFDQFGGDDNVLVAINADPDAIASAMAIKRLLWRRVSSVTVASINVIQRPDNLAMVRLLGLRLEHMERLAPAGFSAVVMVDSQPCHSPCFAALPVRAVIDHHPDSGVKCPFVDIRPRYGATASMLTEYLRAAHIKPSAKLATGLFLGIKIDTGSFSRQTLMEDINAFQYLFRFANMTLARRIEQAELTVGFLKDFRNALQLLRLRRHRAFAHLGAVSTPDVCVLVADFLMRIDTLTWSIVSGIHDRKLIVVLRNDGLRRSAGTVAKESFGALGSAGGHKTMARAEIALDDLKKHLEVKDSRLLARWIVSRIEIRAGKQ
jgi:nanoRNase/pAp phosphatase (c-di-AMP/oligoRNAs hydrolase)